MCGPKIQSMVRNKGLPVRRLRGKSIKAREVVLHQTLDLLLRNAVVGTVLMSLTLYPYNFDLGLLVLDMFGALSGIIAKFES